MPVVIDKNMDSEMADNIKIIDNNTIKSFDCSKIYAPLNTHPDLQIHKVSDDRVYAEPCCFEYYKEILSPHIEVIKGNSVNGGTYTSHVAYNIARVGKNIFCNTKYADKNIIDYYEKNDYRIIHINQGYSKCNICIVSDNAVITEDSGIARTMKAVKINVCEIKAGSVGLCEFPYGFIGGASGIVNNNLLFCGDIKRHPQYDEICRFINENSDLKIVSLSENKLWDYGSIIEI